MPALQAEQSKDAAIESCSLITAMIARQFGNPHGVLGHLVGRVMARGNGEFNRWVVQQLAMHTPHDVRRVVEIGPGPGIGLEEALRRFPQAAVWGIDLSKEMLYQSHRRNLGDAESGRLTLLQGDTSSLAGLAPLDLVYAVHVLYFWRQPEIELAQVRCALALGGALGLGYRLRKDMPSISQRDFARAGYRLYDDERELVSLLANAGFRAIEHHLEDGERNAPGGRLVIALNV